TKLIPQHTEGARVEEFSSKSRGKAYRLTIPVGPGNKYRLAQLDDYAQTPRSKFPLRFPQSLSLSARASSGSIPGTWGFGFWNHPFGLSLGFDGSGLRLPTLPNAVWFFHASKENYLSFRDGSITPPTNGGSAPPSGTAQRDIAANGFLAQVFRSPRFHPLLILAALAFPFSRRTARRLMGRVIGEDGINLSRVDQPVDPTQWHRYRLDWRAEGVSFEVDGAQLFESPVSPHPPLGLVIWIDNQYAAFTPEGRIGFGVLENPEPAWLEIQDLELR
ncbi:MAG TPA: hypothetical protein VFO91_10205, partial [Anaerolineales bacterium]|nr:hypothetical protein [Anaerolineales bacterium]